jgi:hypothetical protein
MGTWQSADCGKVTQMNDWCETEWAGVAQFFRLHRNVQDGEKVREETVYGLTNLPREESQCLALARLATNPLAHRKSAIPASRSHVEPEDARPGSV